MEAARSLGGERDARRLALMLARPRFSPLIDLIESLDAWCRSTSASHRRLFAPGLLDVSRAELFGPLISSAFTLCAAGAADLAEEGTRSLLDGFKAFFALFAARLSRDERAGVLRRAGYHLPVAGLWASPEETHNGQQRVLQLRFLGGGALAYKPRPGGGEAIFVAEGRGGARARSVFELLNRLPAAAGPVRLPTMRVLEGAGQDRFAYHWQEWIRPPRQWGTLRRSAGHHLDGCRLTPAEARRFWHRAGSLAAACFGFGIADLYAGNALTGARPGERQPLVHLVDLEVYFAPIEGLPETGLVGDERERGNHHVGFERLARWCSAEGPAACFFRRRGGGLSFRKLTHAWTREEARSVVADTSGNVGYGAYLAPFLRGMFDVWALLLMERPRVQALLERACRGRFVRVMVKQTSTYQEELERRLFSRRGHPARGRARFSREELEQLGRFDVPYFLRPAAGGPLLCLASPPGAARLQRAGRQHFQGAGSPPSALVRACGQLTLVNLGVSIRDAVAFVLKDVPERTIEDRRLGVRVEIHGPRSGTASFDWPQADRRLAYSWNGRRVRVAVEELRAPA